jgi:hypothetical protein
MSAFVQSSRNEPTIFVELMSKKALAMVEAATAPAMETIDHARFPDLMAVVTEMRATIRNLERRITDYGVDHRRLARKTDSLDRMMMTLNRRRDGAA